jgi:hypothetical protein
MDDVTTAVERVGTCLRDLWNVYFYAGDDISSYPAVVQDLFEEIETRTIGALLLFGLNRLSFMERFTQEAFPFLIVVPGGEGTPVLINRSPTSGSGYWDAFDGRVGPTEVAFHFVEWFDWNIYGRRPFQYYRAKVHAFETRPEFVGREALIECDRARVLFDPGVS